MATRQNLTLYIDAISLRARDSTTNRTLDQMQVPIVALRTHLLKIYLQTTTDGGATWSAQAVPAAATLTAMIKAADASGNPTGDALVTEQTHWQETAEWASADRASGYLCVVLNCNTTEMVAALAAADGDFDGVLEMNWQETGELPATFALIPIRILKPAHEGDEGAPTAGSPTYYTAAQIDGKLSIPSGMRLVVDTDGTIRVESIA